MKNIETPDKMHLSKLLGELRDGRFVIPDFQREFTWSPGDVSELLQSIFKDYYIGTLLLWRASRDNVEALNCEPIYGFDGKSDPSHIVLDGQQRLSALYYVLFAPDKFFPKRKSQYYFFLHLEQLYNEQYDDAFTYEGAGSRKLKSLLENVTQQYERKIFPLHLLSQKSKVLTRWLDDYEEYWAGKTTPEAASKEREYIEKFFDELFDSYDISYIELDRDMDIAKVCDIFTKINNTGVDLTIFDLLNALLKPKGIRLKEEWRKVSDELGDFAWDKIRVHFLQAMSIAKQGYCSPQYLYYMVPDAVKTVNEDGVREKTVLVSSSEEFMRLWNATVSQVLATIKALQNPRDYGAIKPNLVPYPTMLPILSALRSLKESAKVEDQQGINNKIKRWYWSSILTQSYSRSVESRIAQDYFAMKRWFADDNEVPQVIEDAAQELNTLNLANEMSAYSAIYRAVLNIPVIEGARDWVTFDLPEYSALDVHHIVPRKWGQQQGLGKNIDTVLNRTLLLNETNRAIIRDRLPSEYLPELKAKASTEQAFYDLMESHLLSRAAIGVLLRKPFTKDDYKEFLDERRKTILSKFKQLILNQSGTTNLKDIEAVIAAGENEVVEFKSSLKWDYYQNKPNKELEYPVAKTVAAFLNSQGGTLIIGVGDEGRVLGLQKDYENLSKGNGDGFLLALNQALINYLGKEAMSYVEVNITEVHGAEVCVVEVTASIKPVYLKNKDKEEFFVRMANSTQPLSLSEAQTYIENKK